LYRRGAKKIRGMQVVSHQKSWEKGWRRFINKGTTKFMEPKCHQPAGRECRLQGKRGKTRVGAKTVPKMKSPATNKKKRAKGGVDKDIPQMP